MTGGTERGALVFLMASLLNGCQETADHRSVQEPVRDPAPAVASIAPESPSVEIQMEDAIWIHGFADPEEAFGDIVDVEIDEGRGVLLVLDRLEARVTVHRAETGERAGTLGGGGKGPGEYLDPRRFWLLSDRDVCGRSECLLIWDPAAGRMTATAIDGEILSTWLITDSLMGTHRSSPRSRLTKRVEYRDRGFLLETHSDPLTHPEPGSQKGYLIRTDLRFGIRDTLHVFPVPHMEARREGPVLYWDDPPFFSPTTEWRVLSDGIVTVETGTYVIALRDELGRIRWTKRVDTSVEPITREDRVARIKAQAELYGSSTKLPLFLLERRLRDRFPEFGLRVSQVATVPGSIWIERFDTDGNAFGKSGVWDVFDPEGTYLGSVRTPSNLHLVAGSPEELYFVIVDDDFVEGIARFDNPLGEGGE